MLHRASSPAYHKAPARAGQHNTRKDQPLLITQNQKQNRPDRAAKRHRSGNREPLQLNFISAQHNFPAIRIAPTQMVKTISPLGRRRILITTNLMPAHYLAFCHKRPPTHPSAS